MTASVESTSFSELGSILMGAIFMSNRETKRECFQRKLFGLPSQHEGFVKKVRTGMLLFLFEYEERKLYGVFEATSDGSSNIIRDAFCYSGKLFSAQVHFKQLWRCEPLSEEEFSDAIKENYYAPKKFNFALSGDQVLKLLSLFNTRRVPHQNNYMKESPMNFRRYRGASYPYRRGAYPSRGPPRGPFRPSEETTLVRAHYSHAAICPDNIFHSGPHLQYQGDNSFLRNTQDNIFPRNTQVSPFSRSTSAPYTQDNPFSRNTAESSIKHPSHPSPQFSKYSHDHPAIHIGRSANRETESRPRDLSDSGSEPRHTCCSHFSYHSVPVDVDDSRLPLSDQKIPNSQLVLRDSDKSLPACDLYIPLSSEEVPQSTRFIDQKSESHLALNNLSFEVPQNPHSVGSWPISSTKGQGNGDLNKHASITEADHRCIAFSRASVQNSPNQYVSSESVNDLSLMSFQRDQFKKDSPSSLTIPTDNQKIDSLNHELIEGPHNATPSTEHKTDNNRGELYSDNSQRRSVFSRLSRDLNAECVPRFKQQNMTSKLGFGITMQQIVQNLAVKSCCWQTGFNSNMNHPVRHMTGWDQKQFHAHSADRWAGNSGNLPSDENSTSNFEGLDSCEVKHFYRTGWGQKEFHAHSAERWAGSSSNLQSDEDSTSNFEGSDSHKDYGEAHLFLNFKRRREVQKGDGAAILTSSGEHSPGKLKRKKLVRPSFNDVPADTIDEKEGDRASLCTDLQIHESANYDKVTEDGHTVKSEKDVAADMENNKAMKVPVKLEKDNAADAEKCCDIALELVVKSEKDVAETCYEGTVEAIVRTEKYNSADVEKFIVKSEKDVAETCRDETVETIVTTEKDNAADVEKFIVKSEIDVAETCCDETVETKVKSEIVETCCGEAVDTVVETEKNITSIVETSCNEALETFVKNEKELASDVEKYCNEALKTVANAIAEKNVVEYN